MTKTEVETKLKSAYPDCELVVTDLTGTENHYEVRIASERFTGLNRIQCHKAVMAVFSPELASGEIHALAIKTLVKS